MASKKKVNGTHPTPEVDIDELETDAVVEVATDTLTGDIRDFMLDRIRYEQDKRPWDERSEFDQRDTIARVEAKVRDVITRAVEMIAANGRRTIKATLAQVTVKDGIKATIEMSRFDEQRHALIDSTGSRILIVVADPEDFTGERAPVEVKPDQSDLVVAASVVHSEPDGTPFH